MGRLERHQKKQLTTTIIIFVVILVLLLYFIFTTGFRILLSSSAFVANFFSKTSSLPLTKNNQLVGSINIDNIPQATNSAKILVSGSLVNFNRLEFYLNGEIVKQIDINSDTFAEEIGDLKKGDNQVYIKAETTDNKNEKETIIYKVFYKDEKPKLVISEPADKSTTDNSEIKIKGLTDKETFVRVNDLPIVVDADGSFETTVRLKDGDNQIVITALDIAGNLETNTLTVTYQKD
jgi:hypothetical protein